MNNILLRSVLSSFLLVIMAGYGFAQNHDHKKYQGLLWEISGNGLEHPSYLFGTMHVSKKMVFQLSDSFYHALKSVHTVAIELNPESWQVDMARIDRLQKGYAGFSESFSQDYLDDHSFRLEDFREELKYALRTEPTIVNNLLYRSLKSKEDFEEDTFLDLYIYQTAKRSGKVTTGVEDYFETEKIVLGGYIDMVGEKKKTYDLGNDTYADLEKKTEDAYRKGDLDLLDSLQTILIGSEAFRNKFLIKRNEIQAYSIDTILRKNTVFAGVGAAHLPGKNGVIEILRRMGYTLRPVKLTHNTEGLYQKKIDKVKVPVIFQRQVAEDGSFSVEIPGELYQLTSDPSGLRRKQYADMSNGSYYTVTRINSYHAFEGLSEKQVLAITDSLLYENIPGKILSRKFIEINGYAGMDITNRTRQGNLQRYHILIGPYEIFVFKMSGKEDYVDGPEAAQFFSSIQLQPYESAPHMYQPTQGGFTIAFPAVPTVIENNSLPDGIRRMEYRSADMAKGNAFLVLKKTVNNSQFLEDDSFDLELAYESFITTGFITRTLDKKSGKLNGLPCLTATLKLKDSSVARVNILLSGAQYYLLFARVNQKKDLPPYFSSFRITPYKYGPPVTVIDSFFHFKVETPVVPELDEQFRGLVEGFALKVYNNNDNKGEPYWPKLLSGRFESKETGENIWLTVQPLPKYFKLKEGINLLDEEIAFFTRDRDMVLKQLDSAVLENNSKAYTFVISDTNTNKTIYRRLINSHGKLYRLSAMGPGPQSSGEFLQSFFNSFRPYSMDPDIDIIAGKTEQLFADIHSKDSATAARAYTAFSHIYFSETDVPAMEQFIKDLRYDQKNYFDLKVKAINELAYIKEEKEDKKIPAILRRIYENTLDTTTFKNAVIRTLVLHKTADSYNVLKEILLKDPIVFENEYEYTSFFRDLRDSLVLTRQLFPDMLHMLSIHDYKSHLLETLTILKDSNYITVNDYDEFYTSIYFDAKIALEKQQSRDEGLLKKEIKMEEEDEDEEDNNYKDYLFSEFNNSLYSYAKLLIPFYKKELLVQKMFAKLLASKDLNIQMLTAVVMLTNGMTVSDSIVNRLAYSDNHRSAFYRLLKEARLEGRFPAFAKTQSEMAKSLLAEMSDFEKIDSIHLVKFRKTKTRADEGYVYFYKYRIKKDEKWKIAFSGIQPLNKKEISLEDELTIFTDKVLDAASSEEEQFEKEFKKLLISQRPGGKYFYRNEDFERF